MSELVIEDGYRYIGVRSKTGALYLESVQIGWDSDQIKPVWSWADDFRAATATFTDAAGDAAVLNAEVTQEITKEATYIAEGECTYTALVIYNGTTYTDRKTAMIPKLVFTGPVTYVDENGDLQDAPGTTKILTGTEKSLGSGWYAVVCDISYKDYIGLDGDVKLILCDGTSLEQMYGCFTITETPNTSLTIYGQENNSGRIFQKPGLHRRRFRNFRK